MFCAKGDVAPRMLFPDVAIVGGATPATLRIPSLSVSIVVDRTQDHTVTPTNFGTSKAASLRAPIFSADCAAYAACLQVNLDFDMSFKTCTDGKPGFSPLFKTVQVKPIGCDGYDLRRRDLRDR
jgi:hypothetical protein